MFKSEEKKNIKEAASMLRKIADKIEEGKVVFKRGEEEVELQIPSNLTVEIKVEEEEKERTKRSFEIELEWVEGVDGVEGASSVVVE